MKNRIFGFGLTIVLLVIIVLAGSIWPRFFMNTWLELTDADYRIPAESSRARFKPTVMNTGSGGWWVYGEDVDNYYHSEGGAAYRKLGRAAAAACAGFQPQDVQTWC